MCCDSAGQVADRLIPCAVPADLTRSPGTRAVHLPSPAFRLVSPISRPFRNARFRSFRRDVYAVTTRPSRITTFRIFKATEFFRHPVFQPLPSLLFLVFRHQFLRNLRETQVLQLHGRPPDRRRVGDFVQLIVADAVSREPEFRSEVRVAAAHDDHAGNVQVARNLSVISRQGVVFGGVCIDRAAAGRRRTPEPS